MVRQDPTSQQKTSSADRPLLEMRRISKSFPGVQALDRVDLTVHTGEIHALVGENGAGKSTLIRILAGAENKDEGEIVLDGKAIDFANPSQAIASGINVVYQELMLAPHLSAAENILLGNLWRKRWGIIDWKRVYATAQQRINELGVELDVRKPVGSLTVAQQQIVEITRALQRRSRILVFDEPSAVLGQQDMEILFEVIRRLAARGVGVIYISHRLEELYRVADRVTVLKDGQHVKTLAMQEVESDQLVRLMIGREPTKLFPSATHAPGEVLLDVRGLARSGHFRDISFQVRAGQIVAMAGLVGSGRTALVRTLFGADPHDAGEIWVDGTLANIDTPRDALNFGIGFIPEDRKSEGLLLNRSVRENISIASLPTFSRYLALNVNGEKQHVQQQVQQLNIRTPSVGQVVRVLSGGNQQKIVLARWLSTASRILIFDEPTRGVDVGAKMEIYRLMRQLADQGRAILMVSSDLPEVLGMADEILVMRQGRLVHTLDRQSATEERVMQAAVTGRSDHDR